MQIDVDFIHNQRNTNICMAFSARFGFSQYTCALQTGACHVESDCQRQIGV